MRSAFLYRYDPDGNPYWYWTRPEKDVMNEAKKLARFAFYSHQSKPKHFYTNDAYHRTGILRQGRAVEQRMGGEAVARRRAEETASPEAVIHFVNSG